LSFFGILAAVLVFGAALYWHANLSARRSEVRIVELRQQETESVELGAPTREESVHEWLQAREAVQEQIARGEAGQGQAAQPATLTRSPARCFCSRPGVVANPHDPAHTGLGADLDHMKEQHAKSRRSVRFSGCVAAITVAGCRMPARTSESFGPGGQSRTLSGRLYQAISRT